MNSLIFKCLCGFRGSILSGYAHKTGHLSAGEHTELAPIPDAYILMMDGGGPITGWGRQPDVAIEKFKLANWKSPHFADPPEGWCEALMAKNQSHLARAKLEETEKYAPGWGSLHLNWGEALVYVGRKGEPKGRFALAAGLDLTPGEKAELLHQLPHA